MLDDKRVLVVVPARGGSKGIPLKNLAKVCGETLIAHVGKIVNRLDFVDLAAVSTDHPDIANEAVTCGLRVIPRPPELSGDLVSDLQVLQSALAWAVWSYDVIVMLQPTCPLRTVAHVTATVNKLVEGFDSVWTVTKIDKKYHPLKQLWIHDAGTRALSYYASDAGNIIARQQLNETYIRNGACYAFTRECLLEQKTIMGKRSGAIVIEEPMVNIDTWEDLEEAERVMRA